LEKLHGEVVFNLSHSHNLAVFAFSRDYALGVDLEWMKPEIEFVDLARQFFSAAETTGLLAYPTKERRSAFYRCWTRKEAYIKGRGAGLSIELDSFAVSLDENIDSIRQLSEAGGDDCPAWKVPVMSVVEGYAAALAYRSGPDVIKFFEWDRNFKS
jgi:4'-phosphopantetheinyl transferase